MKLNKNELYAKIVDLDAIYNFVVDRFFIWNWVEPQKFI